MIAGGYTHVEHAGDAGLHVQASSLEALFDQAARGLLDLICDPRSVRAERERAIALEAGSLEELMVSWLNELLFLLETEELLLGRFELRVEAGSESANLRASAHGEQLDPNRHVVRTCVKAATYHGVRVAQRDGAWRAEIVLDL
ncbi:MAG: archease [Deltaproteobacteria bacterium]|nr:archease [Deltaproteobacteria bacterium]